MKTYNELMKQVLVLQRELLDMRVQRILAALATMKTKKRYVRELEDKLGFELRTHHRKLQLEALLEMLEEEPEVFRHVKF
jgi:hypothetical protein